MPDAAVFADFSRRHVFIFSRRHADYYYAADIELFDIFDAEPILMLLL
jgi:hypothetical protein